MGKRQVHIIRVRTPVTVVLLVLVSAGMAALIYSLSGRAYAAETHPIREIVARVFGAGGRVSRESMLAFLMPILANVLLFLPWGFLFFLVLDRPQRPRKFTYALTLAGAVVFAAAMVLWQETLPTRVTSPPDALANAIGALGGAALGHARKGVHVRFEI
jgi:glycopeptide antibiotics resistance protein